MKYEHIRIVIILVLNIFILNSTDAIDCYFCNKCSNTERGARIAARSEDWCYKVVWRSGPGNQQIVSRGASGDCRQDSYKEPTMFVRGVYTGIARYCCQGHLCNATSKRIFYPFLFLFVLLLLIFF